MPVMVRKRKTVPGGTMALPSLLCSPPRILPLWCSEPAGADQRGTLAGWLGWLPATVTKLLPLQTTNGKGTTDFSYPSFISLFLLVQCG